MGRRRFRLRLRLNWVCIARASPCVRVFSASSFRSKSSSSASIKYGNISEFPSMRQDSSCGKVRDKEDERGNRIMVVVDSSLEAKGALDWALSHAVQNQDTVLLLHVAKPSTQGVESTEKLNMKAYQLLLDMKKMCEMRRPRVQVKVIKVKGEEKGAAIVEEAKQQKASLLVIGQRKRSIVWGIVRRWWVRKRSTASGVADYCIQNASCMTIAVRRKNKKLGGYLITTKRHKNFWLLA